MEAFQKVKGEIFVSKRKKHNSKRKNTIQKVNYISKGKKNLKLNSIFATPKCIC
jgi:hypothetical protein